MPLAGCKRRLIGLSSSGYTSTIPTARTIPPNPSSTQYHDHLYDGEIAYADHELGGV